MDFFFIDIARPPRVVSWSHASWYKYTHAVPRSQVLSGRSTKKKHSGRSRPEEYLSAVLEGSTTNFAVALMPCHTTAIGASMPSVPPCPTAYHRCLHYYAMVPQSQCVAVMVP